MYENLKKIRERASIRIYVTRYRFCSRDRIGNPPINLAGRDTVDSSALQ